MNKAKQSFFINLIIISICVICVLLLMIGNYSFNLNKRIDNGDISAKANNNERIIVDLEKTYYNSNKKIILDYHINSSNEVKECNYESDGVYIYDVVCNKDSIRVELFFDKMKENCLYDLCVRLKNGSTIKHSLYGFNIDGKVFLSDKSLGDAKEKYYSYSSNNGLLTEDEIIALRNADIAKDVITTISDKRIEHNRGSVELNTQLLWQDDNSVSHPLAYTKFDVTDNTASVTNTYYTDSNGYFPSGITVLEPVNVDLKIYAAGINTTVYQNYVPLLVNQRWEYFVSSFNPAVVNMTFPVNMTTDYGKAQEISQALIFADRFVAEMRAVNNIPQHIAPVHAVYPYSGANSHYLSLTDTIYLLGSGDDLDYADWDVIIHEYGHHVAHKLNIEGVVRSDYIHTEIENLADTYGKYDGVTIAWAEAWATVFSEIVQQYYANQLTNIVGVADGAYSDFASTPNSSYEYHYNTIELEKMIAYGEACEGAIIGFLWDLFDNDSGESHDSISLSYSDYWNLSINSGANNFSDFTNYFNTVYTTSTMRKAYGKLLEYYKMAASDFHSTSNSTELGESTPSFSWTANGTSSTLQNNSFTVRFYNHNFSSHLDVSTTSTSLTLTSSQWSTILHWEDEDITVVVYAYQTDSPQTGAYQSAYYEFTKPIYVTSISNGQVTIVGAYCDLSGIIIIPSYIYGLPVTAIGPQAFMYRTALNGAVLPTTLTSIGNEAFRLCSSFTTLGISTTVITSIGSYAFHGCDLLGVDDMPSTLTYIGEGAFYSAGTIKAIPTSVTTIGNYAFAYADISSLYLSSSVTSMGYDVFYACNNATFYTMHISKPYGWNSSWNSSNRPVVWGCSGSDGYVTSFTKTNSNPSNINATNGVSDPYRKNYTFGAWYTNSNLTGTSYSNISSAPNGTLYARWDSSSCIAEGSLITLADGSQVAVEDLTGEEDLLVWNMLTGQYDTAPILFIDSDPTAIYEVINLTFADGTEVKVIDEHAFFDMTTGEYVFLRSDAAQYIGHYFNKQGNNGAWNTVQLTAVSINNEVTSAWSPVTYGHLCYYVNGMLTMPGATEGFINIFDVDTTLMKYDATAMAADIQTYGLYTYEEFNAIIPLPEFVFNAFNGQYLKVSVGKGLIILGDIAALLDRYSLFFV